MGGCWRERWRAPGRGCAKVEKAKGAPGTTNPLASVLCLLLFPYNFPHEFLLIWASLAEHA